MASKDSKEKLSKEEKLEQQKKIKDQKAKEARRKKKLNEAKKRINAIIKMPFRILFNSTIFVSLIAFIFIYFWLEIELYQSILYVFFIFTSIYISVGITMAIYYYMLSEEKIKELNERLAEEQLKKEEEEKLRQKQEMEELEAIEREMLERRNKNKEQVIQLESSETDEEQQDLNLSQEDNLGNLYDDMDNNDDYLNEILGSEFDNNQK